MSINRRNTPAPRHSGLSLVLWLAVAVVHSAAAGEAVSAVTGIQSLEAIRSAAVDLVHAYLPVSATAAGRKAIVTAGYLDSRLRLVSCPGELTASRPVGSKLTLRNTVAVSCKQGAEWTVYVPVMLESEGPVLVTTRAVARGEGLTAADVEARIQRVPGLASHFVSDPGELPGRHARRALSAGTVVSNDLLATDLLIKRGQQVTLLTSVGSIEVRASGKALTDGGAADRVRVQNLNSLRIVEGLVESADIVRIAP